MDESGRSILASAHPGAGQTSASSPHGHSRRRRQSRALAHGRGLSRATWRQLTWTADWHVRDECYAQALAGLIDAQHRQPLAAHWGSGTTSSSDAQFFRAGGHGEVRGRKNLHYGQDPGVKFYTHLSDQFGPYHTNVIAASANEAPHVLDGLLYHESCLVIDEHYTDTGGFSDHVFAVCRAGFRFAPRIRNLKEKRLYPLPGVKVPPRARVPWWPAPST